VIDRPLLGSSAGHAEYDGHCEVLSLCVAAVIPDAPKARSGIQMRATRLFLDSGFALTRAPE
jgi:hypothetical protein